MQRKSIFISYAREDGPSAKRLYADLKNAGLDPWLDSENLVPGQKWKNAISKAIRQSDFFVALLSSKSLSKRGYIQKELREAIDVLMEIPEEQIFLIPVRLDLCQPEHEKIQEINWVDLFPVYEQGLRKILIAVGAVSMPQMESSHRSSHRGALPPGIDSEDLSKTGWGVIMPDDLDAEIREALKPLFLYRHAQTIARGNDYYREIASLNETAEDLLARQEDFVPYYLMIVGGPEKIPFSFQRELGLAHSVGRLCFDSPEEYHRYAVNLIATETRRPKAKTGIFFGVENANDEPTKLMAGIIRTLHENVSIHNRSWKFRALTAEQASKKSLIDLLQHNSPAILMLAGHGIVFRPGDKRERNEQGAIVCSDWPGPGHGPLPTDYFFSASDIPQHADLTGMVVLHIGSHSAGTDWGDTAKGSFTSALSRAMLGRDNGALAYIGHVNDIYSPSASEQKPDRFRRLCEDAIFRLLSGRRAGSALEPFLAAFASFSAAIVARYHDATRNPAELASLNLSAADYGGYVIIGDPAAKPSLDGYREI